MSLQVRAESNRAIAAICKGAKTLSDRIAESSAQMRSLFLLRFPESGTQEFPGSVVILQNLLPFSGILQGLLGCLCALLRHVPANVLKRAALRLNLVLDLFQLVVSGLNSFSRLRKHVVSDLDGRLWHLLQFGLNLLDGTTSFVFVELCRCLPTNLELPLVGCLTPLCSAQFFLHFAVLSLSGYAVFFGDSQFLLRLGQCSVRLGRQRFNLGCDGFQLGFESTLFVKDCW